MFSWDRELLDGKTDESRAWREQKDEFWSAETGPKALLGIGWTALLLIALFFTEKNERN